MIRKTFFYLFFISALAFFYVTCSDEVNAQTYKGKVVKVADGDSITILHNGKELRIRLAEIDAPERGQPFWKKSRKALAYYVEKEVQIVEVDIDRYKRVVGQVYANNIWINAEMVAAESLFMKGHYRNGQIKKM